MKDVWIIAFIICILMFTVFFIEILGPIIEGLLMLISSGMVLFIISGCIIWAIEDKK